MIKNIFDRSDADFLLSRLNKLTPETQPEWGKMDVAQMLAHLNVQFEMAYSDLHPKATGIKKFLLTLFVKNGVVNEKPYPKNSRTAPAFIVADEKDFKNEKERLTDFINKTQKLGADYFEGKESLSFGVLSPKEWNNSFVKHIDHHFQQFGV